MSLMSRTNFSFCVCKQSTLDLESEILNYAGYRLANVAKREIHTSSAVFLLRSVVDRFNKSSRFVRRENRAYHLQRRYLCPSTFLRDLPEDAYQKSTLCAFLNTNCTKYHLSECGGHNHHSPCFVGSLKIVGFIGKSRSMTIGYAPSSTLLTIYILSHVPPHPQFTSSSLGTITLNRHLTSLF